MSAIPYGSPSATKRKPDQAFARLLHLANLVDFPILLMCAIAISPFIEYTDNEPLNLLKRSIWLASICITGFTVWSGFVVEKFRNDFGIVPKPQNIALIVLTLMGIASCFYGRKNNILSLELLMINASSLLYLLLSHFSLSRRNLIKVTKIFLIVGAAILLLSYAQIVTGTFSFYKTHVGGRLGGLYWDPNIFARFLSVFSILTLSLATFARNQLRAWQAWACRGLYILCFIPLLLTFSRGGLIVFSVGTVTIFWLKFKSWKVRTIMLVLIATLLTFGLKALKQGERFQGSQEIFAEQSTLGRILVSAGAVEMIKDNFFWGVGFGNFNDEYETSYVPIVGRKFFTRLTTQVTSVHNVILKIWAERGLLAVLAFLVWQGQLLWRLYRYTPRDPFRNSIRIWLLASLLVFFVFGQLFPSYLNQPIFWAICYLTILLRPAESKTIRII